MARPLSAELDLAERRVVVFGGEPAALRYLARLGRTGAHITVVAPAVCPAIGAMAQAGRIRWHERSWQPEDLDDVWYAVACTPEHNEAIALAAEHKRVFCTRADTQGAADVRPDHPAQGVALIGAGPGDPDLITVRGRELLATADVVIVDRLAPLALLADLRPGAEIIDAAKLPYSRTMAQEHINEVMVDRALSGRFVVRLKGGDPYLFGCGFEEVSACAKAGVPVTVVPGVSSALAAPALAGIPVTHRGMAQEVTIVSGHVPTDHAASLVDWSALGRLRGTLVILMGVTHVAKSSELLIRAGRDAATPVVVVQDAATRFQRVLRSTLADLAQDCATHHIAPPAVFVVGPTAGLEAPQAQDAAEAPHTLVP
ncbi:uroporphyrinogen-III C-methyltransferase [Streptomyces alboniger]|uniref:uroporphyrinogen-III C-methyltransferase n=1 Tax=Streptomyces alboniger TaxID=132473 RepID=A0A5J6HRV9_STRAD|nr:uroporphyrinogen-III C-methyltransferase [Streptomyces alboniger]